MPGILTYSQLINETDSEKVYLAEIEPAMKMSGWILTSGQNDTWQVGVEPGLVVSRLKEEKTFLTERSSIANVEANSGSWFFDSATELLYVHTSDSAGPATHYLTAYFLEVFATHPRIFNDRFYKPQIVRIPEFRQGINEKNAGDTIQSSGRFSLLEDSGTPYWTEKLFKYNWLNKRVTLRLGGAHKDYPFSEFKTVAKWILKGNTYSDTQVNFEVADLKSLFKTRIGLIRYDLLTYPNMDPSAEGKTVQIAFGQISNGGAVLVDSTVGTGGKWKLSLYAINSITAVYDDGVSVSFTSDLANGEFTLNVAQQGKITADFTGLKDNGTYIQKGGEISKYILLNFLPLTENDITAADFDAMDTARNYKLGIYIERAVRIEEVFSTIEKSNHCFFSTDRESGTIRMQIFEDPDEEDVNRIKLNDENMFGIQIDTDEKITYEMNVSYGRDFATGEMKFIQKSDLDASYINDSEEGETIETFLVSKADAQSLAGLLLPFHSKPRIRAKVETHIRPLDRNLHDNVEIIRDKRPDFPDQQFVYRLIELREKAAKNKKRVMLTLLKNLQPGETG